VTPVTGGELQMTDAIRQLMKKEDVYASISPRKRFDTRDKPGYIRTIIGYTMEDTWMMGELMEFSKMRKM
jgi:UTP--glucose-1-phosphate uridylyltransferase